MAVAEASGRERCMAAVRRHWGALAEAEEVHQSDEEIVLEAVRQSWRALAQASQSLRCDREIVLVAVKQDGRALEFAAESCKGDREIVQAAVEQSWLALKHAADELLADGDFLPHARVHFCLLKVTMLSGTGCFCLYSAGATCCCGTEHVLATCCKRLGLPPSSTGQLVAGSTVILDRTR
eukprot:4462208-Amphidinium_carterae.1